MRTQKTREIQPVKKYNKRFKARKEHANYKGKQSSKQEALRQSDPV